MTSAHKLGPIVVSDGNRKVGRIVTTSRPSVTCPSSCPFLGEGCYGTGRMWAQANRLASDDAWSRLAHAFARAARRGDRVARDRVLGDVVTRDSRGRERVDHAYIRAIMSAVDSARESVGRAPKVFGYTHAWKRFTARDVARIAATGYVMNASCETRDDVAKAVDLGMPVVMANDDVREGEVIAGRRVVTCLEQSRGISCADCGLCASADRRTIVRFRIHGPAKARARATVASLQASTL